MVSKSSQAVMHPISIIFVVALALFGIFAIANGFLALAGREPVLSVQGPNAPAAPDEQTVATTICGWAATNIYRVTTFLGRVEYQAKSQTPTARWDLTWQADNSDLGGPIAIEKDGKFFGTNTITRAFLNCVAGKQVEDIAGNTTHVH